VCPPPDAKAKKSAEYVESKGVLAEKYFVLLHFAIAHMRIWKVGMCYIAWYIPPLLYSTLPFAI